jgi:hypothetical protein
MVPNSRAVIFALSALYLAAADQVWKTKQYPQWTEDDAREVMTVSPWAKTVTPTLVQSSDQDNQSRPGGSRRGGGIGAGGVGIGLPGMGRMGQRGNGRQSDKTNDSPAPSSVPPSKLTLRWESALPMREAELKARDISAPTLDDDHYAIAVYGIPRSMVKDDSKALTDELKRQAVLKREGKNDIKPSSVEILLREDGPVIVYLFSKSGEFVWRDHRLEFDAQVAKLKFSQSFYTDDMMFHGNLEL